MLKEILQRGSSIINKSPYLANYPDYEVDWKDFYDTYAYGPNSQAPTSLVEQEYGPYAGTMISPQFATDASGKPKFTEYMAENEALIDLSDVTSIDESFFDDEGRFLNPEDWSSSGFAYEPGLTSDHPFSPGNTMRSYINPKTMALEQAAYVPPMLNKRGDYGWGPNQRALAYATDQMGDNPDQIKDISEWYAERPEYEDTLAQYFYPQQGVGLNIDRIKEQADKRGVSFYDMLNEVLMHEGGGHGMRKYFGGLDLTKGHAINPSDWYVHYQGSDIYPGTTQWDEEIERLKKDDPYDILEARKYFGHWPIYQSDVMHGANANHPLANYVDKGFPMDQGMASDWKKTQNVAADRVNTWKAEQTQNILQDLDSMIDDRPSTKPDRPPGQPAYGPHIGYNHGGIASLRRY